MENHDFVTARFTNNDRTTVMVCDTGYQEKLSDVFMYADQLRALRDATMEVLC